MTAPMMSHGTEFSTLRDPMLHISAASRTPWLVTSRGLNIWIQLKRLFARGTMHDDEGRLGRWRVPQSIEYFQREASHVHLPRLWDKPRNCNLQVRPMSSKADGFPRYGSKKIPGLKNDATSTEKRSRLKKRSDDTLRTARWSGVSEILKGLTPTITSQHNSLILSVFLGGLIWSAEALFIWELSMLMHWHWLGYALVELQSCAGLRPATLLASTGLGIPSAEDDT